MDTQLNTRHLAILRSLQDAARDADTSLVMPPTPSREELVMRASLYDPLIKHRTQVRRCEALLEELGYVVVLGEGAHSRLYLTQKGKEVAWFAR